MRRISLIGLVALSVASLTACKGGAASGGAEPKTEEQKTLYAAGLYLAKQASAFSLKPDELPYVIQGLRDGLSGDKPTIELNTYEAKLREMVRGRAKEKADAEKKAAGSVLAAAAGESGAEKLPSGLVYKPITEGTGDQPKPTDTVKVDYTGTLRDGTVFDSSVKRGMPATFALNRVIPCWTEGVQKMKVGGKAKLTCPSEIAYGDRGRPPTIPGGAVLTFEVSLLSIEPPGAAPAMSMPGQMHLGGPGMRPGDPHGGALGRPLPMTRPGVPPPGMPRPANAPPPASSTPPAKPATPPASK